MTTHCTDGLEQTPVTHITPNSDFLAAVFRDLLPGERPMVVGVPGAINAQTNWPPGTAWTSDCDTSTVRNWYFTLSTYMPKNVGYRRKKDQFWRAHGVYLDDIGTNKTAPLKRLTACPPSYLIETSAGSYQAGYLFDTPVDDLAQVDALQESLVQASLCDPGAKGPSARLGRLPCGINGKYDPPQQCRLVQWHPERRYSITQIVELLELGPVRPAGIASTIRTGITHAISDTVNFIAALPIFDAAMVGAIIGGVFGFVSGAKP